MAVVASDTIGAYACFSIDNELSVFPCDQKWIIGLSWLILLFITVSKVELSFIIPEISSICLSFSFWAPSIMNCDRFMTAELYRQSGCMLFYSSLGPCWSKVSWIRCCNILYLSILSFSICYNLFFSYYFLIASILSLSSLYFFNCSSFFLCFSNLSCYSFSAFNRCSSAFNLCSSAIFCLSSSVIYCYRY